MENIYTAIKPFYYLLKLSGGFPMSFIGPIRKGNLRQKRFDALFAYIPAIPFLVISVLVILNNKPITSQSEFLTLAWNFGLIFFLAMIFHAYCYQLYKRDSIVKYLAQIDSIDRKVKFKHLWV